MRILNYKECRTLLLRSGLVRNHASDLGRTIGPFVLLDKANRRLCFLVVNYAVRQIIAFGLMTDRQLYAALRSI